MPLQATSGAASYDGFGGGPAAVPNYIEECFATHLYTGNGSTQTITNGIDLATKGGLVWLKNRGAAGSHELFDTNRGVGAGYLRTDGTFAQLGSVEDINAFNANGFSLISGGNANAPGSTYASWTFRKQPKFFDVVTWTGDGTNNRQISHSLGSVPGCFIIKALNLDTGTVANWFVYHRSLTAPNANPRNNALFLNTTDQSSSTSWLGADPTSTTITLKPTGGSFTNTPGVNYVAYLFAHDAGGFGLTGTDNVISCGSWTDSGSGTQTITLGYEPQFLIYKRTDASSNWVMLDTMRGCPVVNAAGSTANLYPNLSNAESGGNYAGNGPTATGFTMPTLGGGTYIYIAIRRGPMKTPTTGTSVFSTTFASGGPPAFNAGHVVDLGVSKNKASSDIGFRWASRLNSQGSGAYLTSSDTSAEATNTNYGVFDSNTKWYGTSAVTSSDFFSYNFRRAPGFFDVVCYTDAPTSVQHNLGVSPELIITKNRTASPVFPQSDQWCVGGIATYLTLNSTAARGAGGASTRNATTFNATTVRSADNYYSGIGGVNVVAYLFASCPGVSKVGTYTGNGGSVGTNGSSQTINCGFTGGARFVLIKCTSHTGGWFVFDSARGIVSGGGADPYLLLNSTAAENASTDSLSANSTGFAVNQTTGENLNVTGRTYIYLAIA